MTTWKLVGESTFKKVEEREPTAYRLVGDVSALLVPLAWPIPKPLERYLVYNDAGKIILLWQALVAQCEAPERPSYVAFPETDEELAGYYTAPDGSALARFPWQPDPADPATIPEARPENWAALVAAWYMSQVWFQQRDLVVAFGEAMEALTGLPLERSAPLLHQWLSIEPSGEAVSRVEAGIDLDQEDNPAQVWSAAYYCLTSGLAGEENERQLRHEWLEKVTAAGIEGWDLPAPTATGTTLVQTRAARGAGPAAPGTLGVSLGAAGDLVRRLKAVAAERQATDDVGADAAADPAPERPLLTIVGEGVRRRGGPTPD